MQKDKIKQILVKTALFSGVSSRTIGRVLSTCPVVSYQAKEIIRQDGEPALFLVLSGKVRISSSSGSPGGILNTLSPRYFFGVASLFGKRSGTTVAHAITPCALLKISQETVEELLAGDFVFTKNYITFLSERIRFLNQKISAFTAENCEGKLARYLLSLPETDGTLLLPMSMQKLSLNLGIARASLYRAFDFFSDNGYLERDGRVVHIHDYAEFSKIYK